MKPHSFARSEGAQQPQDEKDHADAPSYGKNWPKPGEVLLKVVLVHGNVLRSVRFKAHLIWHGDRSDAGHRAL